MHRFEETEVKRCGQSEEKVAVLAQKRWENAQVTKKGKRDVVFICVFLMQLPL
jgi:hypothetical protein